MDTPLEFFEKGSAKDFHTIFNIYNEAITERIGLKKTGAQTLKNLDKWFQESLPEIIQSREKPFLTHDELVKLMEWKINRGKFRPLMKLVQSNDSKMVEVVTRDGIAAAAKNAEKGIKELTKLKGIGPASASAIVAAALPDKFCFMTDESAKTLLQSNSLKYTLPEYLEMNSLILKKMKQLNSKDSKGEIVWTAHKVEKTLWNYCILKENKPEAVQKALGKKRQSDRDEPVTAKKSKRNA